MHLFAERHTVKFIEHGLVEALADPIGLRAFGLDAGMINVLDCEIELILVPLRVPAGLASGTEIGGCYTGVASPRPCDVARFWYGSLHPRRNNGVTPCFRYAGAIR